MHSKKRISDEIDEFEEYLFNLESSLLDENGKEPGKTLFLFRYA